MASIIEITSDNTALVGVDLDDIGRVAVIDGSDITIVDDTAAALHTLSAREPSGTAPSVKEVHPVGTGRHWITID